MKKVYGYIRVSTAKQGEGVSLLVQKEAIERYAHQHGLNIVKWFEEKETAAKQGRPLFMAMMKLLKARKAAGVIMHKIDRSARNLKDWADLGHLIDQGVEVHFAHESLDMQARGGRLSADIQAVIAADYIRNLRQEAIKGLYRRLGQGIYPFFAPVGYLDNGKGKYKTIDPVQGALVRKAFELYGSEKFKFDSLLEHMRKLGLMTKKKTPLSKNGLSSILNNPFYMGIIRVKGKHYNGGHEPLITPQQFNKVQTILRRGTNQKVIKHDFAFRKTITCKLCGYFLIAETQKGHTYYRCHTKACPTKGVRSERIEQGLLREFSLAQLSHDESEILNEIIGDLEKESAASRDSILQSVKLQSSQIKNRIERLTDCYVEGGLDRETYEQRKQKLLSELKEMEFTQNEILTKEDMLFARLRNFLELSKSLVRSYESGLIEEKRELVKIVTSNLQIEGKNLMITMKMPFYNLANRWNLNLGAHERDKPRILGSKGFDCDNNLSPITEPLTKAQWQEFFPQILDAVSQLPDLDS